MLLRVDRISLSIGALDILRDIDLNLIGSGGITSIIGPNGAGKTTLFNVITGRIRPTRGDIFFQEKRITNAQPYHLAQMGIARSFQINNVFQRMSVLDNVCVAVQSKSARREAIFSQVSRDHRNREKAEKILNLIGLEEHMNKLASELSHGDQRRLEIAMSIAIQPELLMLDEPTSGMSPNETLETMRLIDHLGKEVTVCLIEHKMNLVMSLSERIIVLHLGQKIAEGDPRTVAANEDVQKVYLGTT